MTNKASVKKKTKNKIKTRSKPTKSSVRSKTKPSAKKYSKPKTKVAARRSVKKAVKSRKKSSRPTKNRSASKPKSAKTKTKKSTGKKLVKKSALRKKQSKIKAGKKKSRSKSSSRKKIKVSKKVKNVSRKKAKKGQGKKRPVKKTKKKRVSSAKAKVRKGKRPSKEQKTRKKRKTAKKKSKKSQTIRKSYPAAGTPLEQLFESPTRVQVMKLFFRNPEESFLLQEATKIMRINLPKVRKEISRLEKVGLLRSRRISPRKQLFYLNEGFDFFKELKELILRASPVPKDKILKAAKGLGKIKVVLLSGIFTGTNRSRADLLIVGDNINPRKLNTFIKNLEAEAGTEINCAVMNTEEFNYRYDMYDRFVRDLLEEKCEFLMNRLGI